MKTIIQKIASIAIVLTAVQITINAQMDAVALLETEDSYDWAYLHHDDDLHDMTGVEISEEENVEIELPETTAVAPISLIESFKLDADVRVYPNPAVEDIQISYDLFDEERLSLRMYDLNGQLVMTFFSDERTSSGRYIEMLNIEKVDSGQYIIVLSSPSQSLALPVSKY